MWFGVVGILALLIALRYTGIFASHLSCVSGLFSLPKTSLATSFAFPLGISFYSFEAIAYLIDLRQGRIKLAGYADICLFFFFWPNILSGPIVRSRELMPQLKFEKAFEPRLCFEGMDRLVWGLVQKNVIANLLGIWVDRGFSLQNQARLSTPDAWCLAIAFGLQIYFDFAAYTNMAIGAARLLGVTLPDNFRQPYLAATPAEFWNRWHMTLSRWIRDYLFFPINARWKGTPLQLYLSLIGVMGLVGLWHGPSWGFVLWGVLHGAYLVLYRIYESWSNERQMSQTSTGMKITWRAFTLAAVVIAWVPFRAANLQQAGSILSSMTYRFGLGHSFQSGFYLMTLVVSLFCATEAALMAKLAEVEERAGAEGPSVFRVLVRPIAYLFGILLFLLFDENSAQFIYSQF